MFLPKFRLETKIDSRRNTWENIQEGIDTTACTPAFCSPQSQTRNISDNFPVNSTACASQQHVREVVVF